MKKKIFVFALIVSFLISCDTNSSEKNININAIVKDTLSYPYKALYCSDLSMSSNPEYV